MKRIFITSALLLSTLINFAQQDALFSQYMFNPFSINPAYAGSRNSLSGVMLGRYQWAGIEGAPKTAALAIHSPFKGKNFALGFNAFTESIGPSNNSGAFATYAYHIRMGVGKLSLGLRGGFFSTRLNSDRLTFVDPTDVNASREFLSDFEPNFDFGAYYYTRRFFVGASASHLNASSNTNASATSGNTFSTLGTDLDRHYMLTTGVAIVNNPNLVFKPSILFKYVAGAPLNVDLNMSVLLSKVFWIGASYRSSGSLVAILEYNFTDFARLGYAYDYSIGKLRTYTSGSHEIFLGFDLNMSKKKAISTRYL